MRKAGIAVALAAALALAACGDDGGAGDSMEGGPQNPATAPVDPEPRAPADGGVLTGSLPLLNGRPQRLAAYEDRVVLVVNTASECGFTPQFEQLEQLYRERRQRGFVVLGFPADDIAGQEPRSDAEIAEFCEANFGVSFPMFARSNVVDEPVNPLFAALGASLGEPSWNFNKYLLDRGGRPVERFDQGTEPDDPALTARIDALLGS